MSRSTATIEVQKTRPLGLGRYVLRLVEKIKDLQKEIRSLRRQLAILEREHEELKKIPMSHQAPSARSGAKPAQLKSDSKRRGRKPGAKPGHRASTRKRPEPVEIDREESHTLNYKLHHACPECNEPFGKPTSVKRSRIIIDIVIPQKPEVVKHHLDRCWCSPCRKYSEPVVADALPGFTIGLRTIIY